jgi:hypothetical protein
LSDTKSFTVVVNEVNSAPVLTVPADRTINELTTLVVTNTATDGDLPANALTFGLVSAPSGVNLDATTGVLTWTPDEAQGPSTNLITVRVTDNGNPPLNDTKSFRVVVNEVNSAPVLTVPADETVDELTTLVVTNTAADGDLPANALTFSLVSAQSGVNLDATTGVLSWTPSEAQGPSTNLVTVRVTDNGNPPLSDTRSFTVVVNEVNSAPVLAPIPDQTVLAGSQLSLTNSATDPDVPVNVLTFSLGPGVPTGATLDPTSGVFTWAVPTNQVSGTNVVNIRVADNGSPSLADVWTFNIVVVSAPVIETIAFSNSSVTISWEAVEGWTYRVQYKSNLNDSDWTDLAGDVVAPGSVGMKTDPAPSTMQRYYRIVLLP